MIKNRTCQLILTAALTCAGADASIIFNFDNDSLGTATQFTDTAGGISATFASTADPGSFAVLPSFFQTLTGNVLGDPGPAGMDNLALSIVFSRDLGALSLNFATSDFATASPFLLKAYENSTLVGSASSTGNFLNGFTFPEGELAFTGAAFNRVVLSSTAQDFAVDNIAVVAAPEPAASATLGTGLIVLGLLFQRRRKALHVTKIK